jgi:hypothetical protein
MEPNSPLEAQTSSTTFDNSSLRGRNIRYVKRCLAELYRKRFWRWASDAGVNGGRSGREYRVLNVPIPVSKVAIDATVPISDSGASDATELATGNSESSTPSILSDTRLSDTETATRPVVFNGPSVATDFLYGGKTCASSVASDATRSSLSSHNHSIEHPNETPTAEAAFGFQSKTTSSLFDGLYDTD